MNEEWKDIPEFSNYQISNLGFIRNKKTGRILKSATNGSGYLGCSLSNKGKKSTKKIHRLVAEMFLTKTEDNQEVNHIDGNKLNNRLDNLEWVSKSANIKHAYDKDLISPSKGEKHYKSFLTQEDIDWIRTNYIPRDKEFGSTALAIRFNISQSAISNIIHRKSWKTCKNS